MKCPCCGAAELINDSRDLSYSYKGQSTSIPAVMGEFCPACGEVVLNREHGDRYNEFVGALQRQANMTYFNAENIARVRKKLGLRQQQASEIFGVGINAFSRYENDKAKPPVGLVTLLKLLDKHPDLLDEIRND